MAMNFPCQNLTVARGLNAIFEKVALEDHDLVPTAMGNVTTDEALGTDDENARKKVDNETMNGCGVIGGYPPKTIILQRDGSECGPMFGYVQLGFEQRQDIAIPLLASGGDRRSKPVAWMTPASFPPLSRATTSPDRSTGTISTLTTPEGLLYSSDEDDESNFDPVVFGQDLHMYLLTDFTPSHQTQATGCSAAFHKLPKLLLPRRRNRHERTKKETNRFCAYRSMA
jgi:hypothetical protein